MQDQKKTKKIFPRLFTFKVLGQVKSYNDFINPQIALAYKRGTVA